MGRDRHFIIQSRHRYLDALPIGVGAKRANRHIIIRQRHHHRILYV